MVYFEEDRTVASFYARSKSYGLSQLYVWVYSSMGTLDSDSMHIKTFLLLAVDLNIIIEHRHQVGFFLSRASTLLNNVEAEALMKMEFSEEGGGGNGFIAKIGYSLN